jgi:hypothetical protein
MSRGTAKAVPYVRRNVGGALTMCAERRLSGAALTDEVRKAPL